MAAHGGGTTNGCEALVLQERDEGFLRARAWHVARSACRVSEKEDNPMADDHDGNPWERA
jgi:hypothetical protein